MKKKEFKTESKKLMELMINSIYTNKEIFLREIISNASDAIDKLYYNSLVDDNIKVNHKNLEINIAIDKDARTLTISDNGIGMDEATRDNLNDYINDKNNNFKGIALRNINRRLKLNYGSNYGLEIFSIEGKGTSMVLTLPFIIK